MDDKPELVSDAATALEAFLADKYGIELDADLRLPFLSAIIATLDFIYEAGKAAGRKQEPSEN